MEITLTYANSENAAGNDIEMFEYQPYLKGEDYLCLVKVWDNPEDDLYN